MVQIVFNKCLCVGGNQSVFGFIRRLKTTAFWISCRVLVACMGSPSRCKLQQFNVKMTEQAPEW